LGTDRTELQMKQKALETKEVTCNLRSVFYDKMLVRPTRFILHANYRPLLVHWNIELSVGNQIYGGVHSW